VNCRVCGRQFDPTGFQILVPALKLGFDRVECALEASAFGLPPEQSAEPASDPLRSLPTAAAVPALAGGPPVAMAGEARLRPQVLAGTNLAVLAAATAATIYLWLRVFGPDLGPIFPTDNAAPAFERSTIAATIDLTPPPDSRPQPESAVGGGGSQPALAPTPALVVSDTGRRTDDSTSNRPKPSEQPRSRGNGGPVVRPSPPPPPPAPPADPTPPRSAPVPTFPVPSSPPDDRVPGPSLPGGGGGANPEMPSLPGSGGGRP
jgi:hypothetical protein